MAKNEKPARNKREMNAVESNACWVEAIRKEHKSFNLNENFSINPKSLVLLAEKPMARRFEEGKEEVDLGDELKQKLTMLSSIPKKKYMIPQTSN